MKKLLIFAIAALGMLACTEKNVPENEGNKNGDLDNGSTNPNEISCNVRTLNFVTDFQVTKSITLIAAGEWSASTNVTWLTIDPASGHGDAFVNITCQKGDPAEGKIIFSTSKASVQVTVHREGSYYPEGFWVSSTQKIVFSQGNLQYQPSTKTWKFAEHQYDIIGNDNKDVISDEQSSGWMDLFAWGTSGYSLASPIGDYLSYSTNPYKNQWNENTENYKGDIAGTYYDWGVYNKISNGGNEAGIWRTLTRDEWKYLIEKRPNAPKLMSYAIVNGIKGVIFLPNGWQIPEGLDFSLSYSYNIYDISSWIKMEQAGAIFLPFTGYAYITWLCAPDYAFPGFPEYNVFYNEIDNYYYWTSTYGGDNEAYLTGGNGCHTTNQHYYHAVRLVKDVE